MNLRPPAFDSEWLALRAPADAEARAASLIAPFAELLATAPQGRPLRLVDLGAGTGANFRHLSQRLAVFARRDQVWRLVDADPGLLGRAEAETRAWAAERDWSVTATGDGFAVHVGASRWTVERVPFDLSAGLSRLPLAPGEGVAITGLLDLVSPGFLAELVEWVIAARAPLLAALSYDGALRWGPADPEDGRILSRFNDHQRRDKGFGPALGPAAPAWLAARLAAAGWRVNRRRSPWRLGANSTALLLRLIAIVAGAATEQDPRTAPQVAAWAERRRAQASAGELAATVGHMDLLARP